MGRFSGSSSHHWMKVKLDYHGEPEWRGISEWDVYYPNSRLRWPRSRVSIFNNERDARRWARRYKVDFPPAPAKS